MSSNLESGTTLSPMRSPHFHTLQAMYCYCYLLLPNSQPTRITQALLVTYQVLKSDVILSQVALSS